jgi:hypothetical protein
MQEQFACTDPWRIKISQLSFQPAVRDIEIMLVDILFPGKQYCRPVSEGNPTGQYAQRKPTFEVHLHCFDLPNYESFSVTELERDGFLPVQIRFRTHGRRIGIEQPRGAIFEIR